jgi:hypothetical protein
MQPLHPGKTTGFSLLAWLEAVSMIAVAVGVVVCGLFGCVDDN